MNQCYSIDKIFLDIHTFIIDYVKLLGVIHENMINIKLGKENFYFPATFNEFSERADGLQHRLQRQIRILAQKRRNDISKGIDNNNGNILINKQKQLYRFDDNFKIHLEQLQKNISIHSIQSIIDAFELYDDIKSKKSSSNNTFRLLPIIKHIQKQLCCISRNIQQILDNNTSIIEEHLRKLQQNLNFYDKDMRNKLTKYISHNIRPPVLVIPCPTTTPSPAQIKSCNAVTSDTDSDHNLVHLTSISSEDSLFIDDD